jgi:hypothetical protein
MEWQVILALTLAVPLMLFPAVLAWYMVVGCGYTVLRRGTKKLSCAVNADCPMQPLLTDERKIVWRRYPKGYICAGGECLPSA